MFCISKSFNSPGKFFCKLFILLFFLFAGNQTLLAQRYNFTQYNIEHGLIQSQVRAFTQSPSHHLWIATQGGVSRFDGSQFYSLTRADNGIADLSVTSLLADSSGKIFMGTPMGLSIYQGNEIRNYKLPPPNNKNIALHGGSDFHTLVKDKTGRILAKINEQVYLFTGSGFRPFKFTGSAKDSVLALTSDSEGNVYAAVYAKGIYELQGNSWKLKYPLPDFPESLKIQQLYVDRTIKDKLWIVTHKKIFFTQKGRLVPYESSVLALGNNFLICMEQDEQSNLWIGTFSGALYIEPKKTTYFQSVNGFTDNSVNQIFRDAENNIWFATEGAGVYKYDGDKTMVLDKGQGLANEIVMGFTTDPEGYLWMNSFGSSLVKLKNGRMTDVKLPIPDSIPYGINDLFTDKEGNVWIGTGGAGLLKYDGKKYRRFPYQPGKVPRVIRHILQDSYGDIWLATPTGCYVVSDGKFSHIGNTTGPVTGLLEIGKDSILISAAKGNYLITGRNHRFELIPNKELGKTDMYCLAKYKDLVLFGTGEKGIWIWDTNKNTYKNINKTDGLYSNTIYGLIADSKGEIWAGTGRGINKINLDPKRDNYIVTGAEYSKRAILECNQGAMFFHLGKLWVGTTKGAMVFDLKQQSVKKEKPHIVLQSVKLFSSGIKKKNEYFSSQNGSSLPKDLQLSYRKNHISFNFKGIYFTNPTDVLYQYRLKGLEEDNFSNPTANSSVNYQTLPPGEYVFEARALNRSGLVSDNLLSFPFSIRPAFYQTIFFKLGIILSLVLMGTGLQVYLHKRKTERLQMIENLKREERLKARQQTAQDFHDDLGNKLTRISILTDILNTKLNGEHQEEKQLIYQIKENASSLYRGTKDILWALDPKSDNLYEILCHISEFGIELFQDTSIEFSYEGIDQHLSNIKFPMEYSRNISMIFKESLNNILRHAKARHVKFDVFDHEENIEINLRDDGQGFDQQQAHKGLGLNNISVRAKRIGARLNVLSIKGTGTNISLLIKKPGI